MSCGLQHMRKLAIALLQAGVDLGSVRADQETEKKRRGKGKRQALPQAQLRPKRRAPISQVLLVGGSTRIPAMRRFVQHMTGLEPATFVQPDEVSRHMVACLSHLDADIINFLCTSCEWLSKACFMTIHSPSGLHGHVLTVY